jgi:hypothetical protein
MFTRVIRRYPQCILDLPVNFLRVTEIAPTSAGAPQSKADRPQNFSIGDFVLRFFQWTVQNTNL